MARSMQKAIDEYHALCDRRGGTFGSFYADEVEQLRKIAEDAGGINFRNIVFEAVYNSLMAGFMVGYRAGLRDSRKKNRG